MPLSGVCVMHPTSIYRQDAAQLHGVYASGCRSPALAQDGYPITMPDMPGTPGKFREAGREQESFFAPVEKRLLIRMARATPRWINSDHLAGRQPGWPAGACAQPAAAALRLLRGSHHRRLRYVVPGGRHGPVGLHEPHGSGGFAGGLFHAVDPGLPGGLRARHIPTLVLEVESHRAAIAVGGG